MTCSRRIQQAVAVLCVVILPIGGCGRLPQSTGRMVALGGSPCFRPAANAAGEDSLENIYPAWSPDGRWIAFTSRRQGNFDVYLVRPDGGPIMRLTDDPGIDAHPAWAPDGAWLSFDSDREGNRDAYVITARGCEETNVTRHPAGDSPLAWAPTGTGVVFTSDRTGREELFGAQLGREKGGRWTLGTLRQLTDSDGRNQAASWAPNGALILFESRREGNRELYVMAPDGPARNVTRHPGPDFLGRWAPDGRSILFWSLRDANEDIYIIGVDGEGLRRLTTDPARDRMPYWSPDGQWIVFSSDRTGVAELYVMRADGSVVRRLTCGLVSCASGTPEN